MGLFSNMRPNNVTLDPFNRKTWNDIERLYFDRVDDLFEREHSDQFANGNAAHAVYLITKFFVKAEKEIRIFSGSLTRKASNGVQIYENPNLVAAAKEFLRNGGELRVVVQHDVDGGVEEHPFVQGLLNESRCNFVRASEDSIEFLRKQKFLHHMMVMDENAWRLETRTRLDRYGSLRSVAALVGVFDRESALLLKDLFDIVLFGEGKELASNIKLSI